MSSNNKIIISFAVLGVFILGFLFFITQNKKMFVVLGGKTFNMEVADTDMTRQRGLSGHKPLEDGEGMIFIFDRPSDYSFWMKDMLFPLDIIWVGENYKIVHMEKSLLPETYPKTFSGGTPALYVLEISGGEAEKLGLSLGDSVIFHQK